MNSRTEYNTPMSLQQLILSANLAFESRDYATAISYLLEAIKLDASDAHIYNNLGNAFIALQKFPEAEACLEKALELKPDLQIGKHNKGILQLSSGAFERAKQSFERLSHQHPDSAEPFFGLASVAEKTNDLVQAREMSERALAINPNYSKAKVLLASVLQRENDYEQAAQMLQEVLIAEPLNIRAHYEQGRVFNHLGHYKEALREFKRANQLADTQQKTKKQFLAECASLQELYIQIDNSAVVPSPEWKESGPLFIVGSPRSGTTLLAEMLGSHSDIINSGELHCIRDTTAEMAQTLKRPFDEQELLKTLCFDENEATFSRCQAHYSKSMRDYTSQARWAIDKQPLNSRRMGLIARFAPGSPIIHIIRDGREVALSAYMQNFRGYHWHAYSLENAICEWEATIHLTRLAADVFRMPYYEVRYEDLVNGPEETLQDLLSFLALGWEEGCLNFHRNTEVAQTASYHQVRQPLYKTSLNRAQNYAEAYAQMTEQAEESLTKLGYI